MSCISPYCPIDNPLDLNPDQSKKVAWAMRWINILIVRDMTYVGDPSTLDAQAVDATAFQSFHNAAVAPFQKSFKGDFRDLPVGSVVTSKEERMIRVKFIGRLNLPTYNLYILYASAIKKSA